MASKVQGEAWHPQTNAFSEADATYNININVHLTIDDVL